MKTSIVAYDRNRVIGHHGAIPWMGNMRADARYFREMTIGHPVIMGRGTYESMGRLLPNRPNIIVTSQPISIRDATVVRTLPEAYQVAQAMDETVFVIGGGQIYEAAMDDVDVIYATEIDASTKGDVYFPAIDPTVWRETSREHHAPDSENSYSYDFVIYSRIESPVS